MCIFTIETAVTVIQAASVPRPLKGGRREAPICLLNWGQTKPCKMGVPVSRHRLPSESVRHPPKRSVIALSWKTASIDHGWVDLHQLDAGYTKEIRHD